MKVWCIHGSMQTPSVWSFLREEFHWSDEPVLVEAVDLCQDSSEGFEEWSARFCKEVEAESGDEKPLLLGYSLGGRLAMHACIDAPELWSGVIIVSADPGSYDKEQKKLQLQKDFEWAQRFKVENMEKLLMEWDQSPVFGQSPNLAPRNLAELDSEKISQWFITYSKGKQADLLPLLSRENNPSILFISGAEDEKYSKIGESLAFACPQINHQVIAGAGHRVPWENKNLFVEVVNQFIASLPLRS